MKNKLEEIILKAIEQNQIKCYHDGMVIARATAEAIFSTIENCMGRNNAIEWKDIMNFRILFLGNWTCYKCGGNKVYADEQGRVYCHGPCLSGTHPGDPGPQGPVQDNAHGQQ